ncbi:Uma2 family endonuclease [Tundrisphaera sp. TA3]|uniref:Uma2 family endonuclease n=1 Tax=Tundrisphaera sp. TA3 TaxID=3435775 RepID=UPI003EBE4142
MATANRDEAGRVGIHETPVLFDGQRLDQPTFHALYLQTPEHFRAELIEGVVRVMASPVRYPHGSFDALMAWFLGCYAADTAGTAVGTNVTFKLDPWNELQPDVALLIEPDQGGQTLLDAGDFLVGAPEFAIEVAVSSLAHDLKSKRQIYEAAGAREYLVIDGVHRAVHWFFLREDRFLDLPVGPDGVYRSITFPGLWLDARAYFRGDRRGMLATLRQGLDTPEHAAFVAQIEQRRLNRP